MGVSLGIGVNYWQQLLNFAVLSRYRCPITTVPSDARSP
jgi:hypothetical protein